MKKLILLAAAVMIFVAIVFILDSGEKEGLVDSYTLYYDGDYRHFRGDLLEASKIEIIPNEDAIRQILLNPEVFKIHIAYIPDDAENAFYLASSFEITSKLSLAYMHYFTGDVSTFEDTDGSSCLLFYYDRQTRCFNSLPINSTDELVPTPIEPVILLLGPSHTNKTQVAVEDNLITIEGSDFTEIGRKYTDLDLAVDKMLLVILGLNQQ